MAIAIGEQQKFDRILLLTLAEKLRRTISSAKCQSTRC